MLCDGADTIRLPSEVRSGHKEMCLLFAFVGFSDGWCIHGSPYIETVSNSLCIVNHVFITILCVVFCVKYCVLVGLRLDFELY